MSHNWAHFSFVLNRLGSGQKLNSPKNLILAYYTHIYLKLIKNMLHPKTKAVEKQSNANQGVANFFTEYQFRARHAKFIQFQHNFVHLSSITPYNRWKLN